MEFIGIIKSIGNERSGVSQSTGKEWSSLEMIVGHEKVNESTGSRYEKTIKFDCFGNICNAVKEFRKVGDEVKVTFDINAKEFNGKWYNSINAIKVEALSGDGNKVVYAEQKKQDLDNSNNANAQSLFDNAEKKEDPDELPF